MTDRIDGDAIRESRQGQSLQQEPNYWQTQVRNDPELKSDVAVWQLSRLGPKQEQTYTLTVASGGITRGLVRWTKPAQGAGRNAPIDVVMQRPSQTNY